MDLKQKKKRIAHNSSSIFGEAEGTMMTDDVMTGIMNAMNITHENKSILSYQQLEDIRKQKRGDSVKASNVATEGSDKSMTFQKRLDLKKNHPLMAKCQKNLKILKHNRTIPKPRAHVGFIPNLPRAKESSSKKCVSKPDQAKLKVESRKKFSKSNEKETKKPFKIRNSKTSESTSHQSKSSDRKRYKRCRLSESDISDDNLTTDKAIDDRSSGSDSCFEKFIKTHNIVNKHKIPTSSDSDSSSDEADYLKPRNPQKKRNLKKRKVSVTVDKNFGKDCTLSTHPAPRVKCVERTNDSSSASDFEPVGGDINFSSDDCSELKLLTPAKIPCQVLSKEKPISCDKNPKKDISKPVFAKNNLTSVKKTSPIGCKSKTSKSKHKKKRTGSTSTPKAETIKSLGIISVPKENIFTRNTDSEYTESFSTQSDVSQKSSTDWVVMGGKETNSVYQNSLKDVNTAPTSDLGIQIEAVFSLGTSDQMKTHGNTFDPPDSDIEVICDDISYSNLTAKNADVASSTISSTASTSKVCSDKRASVSESLEITNKTFSLYVKEVKREKDCSIMHTDSSTAISKCNDNADSVSKGVITDSTSSGECSTFATVQIKEEILDDDIQILPFRIIPCSNENEDHSGVKQKPKEVSEDQLNSIESSVNKNSSINVKESAQSDEHSNVFEALKKIDIGLIKEFVQKSSSPINVKTETNYSDVEVVCIESDDETLPIPRTKTVGDKTAKEKVKQLATHQKQEQNKTGVTPVRDGALLNSNKKARIRQTYEADVLPGPSTPKYSSLKSKRKNKIHKSVKIEGHGSDASDELDSIVASASDALDNIAVSAIKDLGDTKTKNSALLLLELYKKEYERYIEVRSTEQNVSAGLKLLEEKQLEKLKHLVTAIKNVAKNDPYFNKLYKETHPKKSGDSKSQVNFPISTVAVQQAAVSKSEETEVSKQDGPKKTTFKCVECNKPARAACQGCFKVYYCSRECGEAYWSKGHITACGT